MTETTPEVNLLQSENVQKQNFINYISLHVRLQRTRLNFQTPNRRIVIVCDTREENTVAGSLEKIIFQNSKIFRNSTDRFENLCVLKFKKCVSILDTNSWVSIVIKIQARISACLNTARMCTRLCYNTRTENYLLSLTYLFTICIL